MTRIVAVAEREHRKSEPQKDLRESDSLETALRKLEHTMTTAVLDAN